MGESNISSGQLHSLTDKQREVLDLLVLHKTSKEIARILGISPFTVDQRIAAARRKFGATSRNELAAAYMLGAAPGKDIPEESVYRSSYLPTPAEIVDQNSGFDESQFAPAEALIPSDWEWKSAARNGHRVVPEYFEGRFGYLSRIGAIAVITLMLLTAILVGFAIFGQLSELLS